MEWQRVTFTSHENTQSALHRGRDRVVYTLRRYVPQKDAADAPLTPWSMLAKLGICAMACVLVLFASSREQPSLLRAAATQEDETSEEELDEMLGRLKFVELPGLLTVFADDGASLPITGSAYELMEEETLLCMVAAQAQAVRAPEPCTVKALGDSDYGRFVSLRTAADREWIYYGLQSIAVEEGQPLSAEDTLGGVGLGGTLYVQLRVQGKPANLREEFSLEKGL